MFIVVPAVVFVELYNVQTGRHQDHAVGGSQVWFLLTLNSWVRVRISGSVILCCFAFFCCIILYCCHLVVCVQLNFTFDYIMLSRLCRIVFAAIIGDEWPEAQERDCKKRNVPSLIVSQRLEIAVQLTSDNRRTDCGSMDECRRVEMKA